MRAGVGVEGEGLSATRSSAVSFLSSPSSVITKRGTWLGLGLGEGLETGLGSGLGLGFGLGLGLGHHEARHLGGVGEGALEQAPG